MAAAPAIRAQGGGPLGRWVLGPLVGLVALLVLAFRLRARGCGAGGLSSYPAGIAFEAIGLGGALLLLVLGVWRIVRLVRRRGGRRWVDRRILGGSLIVLLAFVVYAVHDTQVGAAVILGVLLFAALAALFGFVALVVAAIQGRSSDEVGALLPAYLVGAALGAYLPLVFVAAALVGGCWSD
jgi:hypothetical protein